MTHHDYIIGLQKINSCKETVEQLEKYCKRNKLQLNDVEDLKDTLSGMKRKIQADFLKSGFRSYRKGRKR